MKRRIIKIDAKMCNGCGLCVDACHEGAIGMVDGKAKLLRDDYCDGLGDCLPVCPTGAITFEEREAAEYDEAAVKANMQKTLPCGCPGTHSKLINRKNDEKCANIQEKSANSLNAFDAQSRLAQWPVQIKLVPVNAPYFDGANLLIAADCTAYAYAAFHERFIMNHITLIGCPKLDMVEYVEKLTEILKNNNIKSVQIVRMEVPCCGGIERAAVTALENCGKNIPHKIYTITTDGHLL